MADSGNPMPPPRPRAFSALSIAVACLVTLAVMALGVMAGIWQYGRYERRADAVAAFDAAQDIAPVPLSHLITPDGTGSAADAARSQAVADAEWRSVTADGYFDQGSLTALRGRTVEGVAALQYLAWFMTADGPLLVNVGWAPRDADREVVLPDGPLQLEGILRVQESDDGRTGEGATRINGAQVPYGDATASYPTPLPVWLMLREPCDESGCVGAPVQPVPVPQLSLGPHLSYAFQWWLLALLAPLATFMFLRRDARAEAEAALGDRAPVPSPSARTPSKRRHASDEEIEDAL